MKRSCLSVARSSDTRASSPGTGDEASLVLSILYGLLVVVLAIVLKVSESIKTLHNKAVLHSNASKNYLCVLFFVAILWLVSFKLYTSWWRKKGAFHEIIKSPHASNRWLKGIVAIFGFSVVVKESLEVVAVAAISNPLCKDKTLYFITPIFHGLFVMGQVIFLFFYAKIHIQDFTMISRFGVMHVMATNFAVWICIIADETNHALAYERIHHNHTMALMSGEATEAGRDRMYTFVDALESHCNITSDIFSILKDNRSNGTSEENDEEPHGTEGLFKGKCICHTNVCQLISRADQFLSPMLIEFCLVASCLLYVTWSNVGTTRKRQHIVVKPSYRFYKSYKGVMAGTLVLLGSVIVMTLLASMDSGVAKDEKSYLTEHHYLTVYETFLAVCNLITLLGCVMAFYAFSVVQAPRKPHSNVGLDVILLFICLVGPLLVGLFSILSLSAGPSASKQPGWLASLAASVTDIIVNLVQILLIVHGLSRKPASSPLSQNSPVTVIPSSSHDEYKTTSLSDRSGLDGTSVIDREKVTIQSHSNEDNNVSDTSLPHSNDKNQILLSVSEWDEERKALVHHSTSNELFVPPSLFQPRNSRAKVLTLPTLPRKARIILRDVIIFLVIANSCLWMLLSLNGTAFVIYTYQSEYFGHSAWTTLTSVTAPLSIFLKLHCAACFFEVWSYS